MHQFVLNAEPFAMRYNRQRLLERTQESRFICLLLPENAGDDQHDQLGREEHQIDGKREEIVLCVRQFAEERDDRQSTVLQQFVSILVAVISQDVAIEGQKRVETVGKEN